MLSTKKYLPFGMFPYITTDCLKNYNYNYNYLDLSSYKSHNKNGKHTDRQTMACHKNCIKFIEHKQLKLLAKTTSTSTVKAARPFVMLISLADTALFCEGVWG